MSDFKYQPGTRVSWRVLANDPEHVGTIIAIVPKRVSIRSLAPHISLVSRALRDFQDSSGVARYLIEVPRKHARTGAQLPSLYLAPAKGRIERLGKLVDERV